MLNNYNKISSFYSFLSQIVFGGKIVAIQKQLIQQLPSEGKLLILGGGNGSILPFIYRHAPKLKIVYQEASSEMIKLAKSKSDPQQSIEFIHSDQLTHIHQCNLILAPFFFDLFEAKKIQEIITDLEASTDYSLTWFVADFHLSPQLPYLFWRKIQVKASILFFIIMAKHRPNSLPNIKHIFNKLNYKTLYTSDLSHGFYSAKVFKLQSY